MILNTACAPSNFSGNGGDAQTVDNQLQGLNTIAKEKSTDLTLHFDRVDEAMDLEAIPQLACIAMVGFTCPQPPPSFATTIMNGPGRLDSHDVQTTDLFLSLSYKSSIPGGADCLNKAKTAKAENRKLDITVVGSILPVSISSPGVVAGSLSDEERTEIDNRYLAAEKVINALVEPPIFVNKNVAVVVTEVKSCVIGGPALPPPPVIQPIGEPRVTQPSPLD